MLVFFLYQNKLHATYLFSWIAGRLLDPCWSSRSELLVFFLSCWQVAGPPAGAPGRTSLSFSWVAGKLLTPCWSSRPDLLVSRALSVSRSLSLSLSLFFLFFFSLSLFLSVPRSPSLFLSPRRRADLIFLKYILFFFMFSLRKKQEPEHTCFFSFFFFNRRLPHLRFDKKVENKDE